MIINKQHTCLWNDVILSSLLRVYYFFMLHLVIAVNHYYFSCIHILENIKMFNVFLRILMRILLSV